MNNTLTGGTWTPVVTNTVPFQFTHPAAAENRYYRAVYVRQKLTP